MGCDAVQNSPPPRCGIYASALLGARDKVTHGEPTFWTRKRMSAVFADAGNHHGAGPDAVWCEASHVTARQRRTGSLQPNGREEVLLRQAQGTVHHLVSHASSTTSSAIARLSTWDPVSTVGVPAFDRDGGCGTIPTSGQR